MAFEVNGKELKLDKDYYVGYDNRMEGTDLVIWMKIDSHKPLTISLK